MSLITVVLQPDADGTLHLPLPEQLRHCKVKVEAKIEAADEEHAGVNEQEQRNHLLEIMERIARRNPFKDIRDPVAWQRDLREDRALPGRD